MMEDVKRPYRSVQRRAQAEETRGRIAAAARTLFVRQGFTATSVRAIADEAGVAEPTVYAVFGAKRTILVELIEGLEAGAGVADLIENLKAAAGDPPRQLRLMVEFDQRLFDRGADILGAAYRAGSTDPELADMLRHGRERGRQARVPIVRGWQATGALRSGLTVDKAIDIFVAMCSHQFYELLVRESGWSPDEWSGWVASTLQRTILND